MVLCTMLMNEEKLCFNPHLNNYHNRVNNLMLYKSFICTSVVALQYLNVE